jgi:hypothetical protein
MAFREIETLAQVVVSSLPKDLAMEMQRTGLWKEACPVALERLALLKVRYVDFEGKEHDDGELVVFDAVGEAVASAFAKMFEKRFPVDKMRSLHHYNGDDEASMADNNTCSFNFRPIARDATVISIHSYGLAIDINPLQNPFVVFDEDNGTASVHPKKGWSFLNRHNRKPGMVEELVDLWAEHGFFVWGGKWTTPIDYHHFQPPRGVADLLMIMDCEEGKRFFSICAAKREHLSQMPSGKALAPLIENFKKDRQAFFENFWQSLK